MNWILTLVTFLPLVGVLGILLTKPPERGSENTIKLIALITSAATFVGTLLILFRFDATNPALQLVDRVNWIP